VTIASTNPVAQKDRTEQKDREVAQKAGEMADGNGRETSSKSTAELARDLSRELATLVHQEIELAKAELSEKGKKAGIATGFLGGAGMFGLLGLGALVACAIAALHVLVPVWAAALVVGAAAEAMAGLLAIAGGHEVKKASPPIPGQAIESTKEDVAWLRSQARSARR
jgi:uncharacterized membrane protein YqjE